MGVYNEIVNFTVSSATTSVNLSNFGTINKGDFIKVVATIVNPISSTNTLSLFVNNETTATDYRFNLYSINNDATNLGDFATDNNKWVVANASKTLELVSYIMISEVDKFVARTNFNVENDTSIEFGDGLVASNITVTNITSFQIESNETNGIGQNSTIKIYKLDIDSDNVIDITVSGSDVTQVDFTNLNITKDNEFLLISSNTSAGGAATGSLFVNDETTAVDYRRINIQGSSGGGPTFTFRSSNANYLFIDGTNETAVSYCTIKLSENNVYSYQSINTRNESPTVILTRIYGSNVEKTFNTITKLNIVSAVTDGIKIGSRLTLYKLK
jgi:hypothetical protein